MKKTLLISGLLIAIAVPVFAQSVPGTCNLAWNDCWLGPTMSAGKTNLCTSTAGFGVMYASFDPPTDVPAYIGCNGVIDIQTNSGGGVLSPWWRFDLPATTSCRGGKMTFGADFTLDPGSCFDFFAGGASGGGNYSTPSPTVAPPSARIKEIWGVPDALAGPLAVGTEVYAFKATILNSINAGFTLANCPGCLDKACIVLNQINIAQPAPAPDMVVTSGPQQYITWQGGTGTGPCPQATPNRSSTWGQVKALYR